MSVSIEQLHQKQEDLTLVVEPLVDSISELVLSAVTGAFENVQACCMDIAQRTNQLVLIAQQVATSSTDVDLQMEVANAINGVAGAIEKLVTSFTQLLMNSNAKTQQDFAGAAKEVGDAINKLCSATDQTSQAKIMAAVKEARASAAQVVEAAAVGKEKLMAVAQVNVDKTVRLVKVATVAAGATADEQKKNLLTDGATRVRTGGPQLIQAAKTVTERPGDSAAKSQLQARLGDMETAFNILVEAAKLSPTYFGKVAETYEYIKKLINAARDLEEAATNLYTVTQHGTDEEFIASAKAAASKALLLCEQAEAAARNEKDPVRKALLKDAAAELREASAEMIKAAKAYRENPNDPAAKARFEQAHRRLEAAIKRVVAATGGEVGDDSPRGKLATSTLALEAAAKRVVHDATHDQKSLVEDAQTLAAVAMQLARDAEAVAALTTDPAEKKRLLENAAEIKAATQRLIDAAKKVAQNPNDPQAQKELADAYNYLLSKVNQVRRDAHLIPGSQTEEESEIKYSGNSEEAQLIAAAKEEAAAALRLAEEADKLADKITDPKKKALIKQAIQDVKDCSRRVVECAEALAKNPHDPVAQQNLSNAQRDLGLAIQRVVNLTNMGNQDKELNDAMDQMSLETGGSGGEGDVLQSAQKVLDQIAATFGNPNKKMTPQEVIEHAKELSTKAAELARQLREMAAKTTDPVFKEKLLNAAKIIRDGSVQIKILSAVRAAGGEDKGNSVTMAAKGLQTNITDIIKEVRANSLRTKFRSTVKQTIAINRVVTAWKKMGKK